MARQLIIRSVEQLQEFKSSSQWRGRGIGRVQLELQAYKRELRFAERAINKSLRSDGIAMAFVFLALGLAAVAVVALLMRVQFAAFGVSTWVVCTAVLAALAWLGRRAGLWLAGWRIGRAIDRLVTHAMWPQPQAAPSMSPSMNDAPTTQQRAA